MRTWVAAAWIGLAGCGVSGEVGGQRVSGTHAIFDVERVDIPFLGSYDVVALVLSDVSGGCDTFNRLSEAGDLPCDERCAAMSDIADDIGAGDHWSASFYAVADAGEIVGTYTWADADVFPEEREFDGQLSLWDLQLASDVASCTAACEDGTDIVNALGFDAGSGVLNVDDWSPEEALDGNIDVGFGGDDDVSGPIHADSCPSLANF